MGYQIRKTCFNCQSKEFSQILDYGDRYLPAYTPTPNEGTKAPLVLRRCNKCNLVQLKHKVAPEDMYSKFWYRSQINEAMRIALSDVVRSANDCVGVKGANVLDIGCNDGTLLSYYGPTVNKVGIDPAVEIITEGVAKGRIDVGVIGLFDKNKVANNGPYKVITSVAMFYDLEDPVQFLKDCGELLAADGVLIIQQNYLKTMLEETTFDNICHEHLTYLSVSVMLDMVAKAGLESQGVELNSVNGGSFRMYITHQGKTLYNMSRTKQTTLYVNQQALAMEEQQMGLDTEVPYFAFARRADAYVKAIKHTVEASEDVYLYGASTRGLTILQSLDLPVGLVQGAAERDPQKYGLYMAGTDIIIRNEDYCRQRAKTFLVLPYHFMDTIMRREDSWLANGGRLIVPLPQPSIVESIGYKSLTEAIQ